MDLCFTTDCWWKRPTMAQESTEVRVLIVQNLQTTQHFATSDAHNRHFVHTIEYSWHKQIRCV